MRAPDPAFQRDVTARYKDKSLTGSDRSLLDTRVERAREASLKISAVQSWKSCFSAKKKKKKKSGDLLTLLIYFCLFSWRKKDLNEKLQRGLVPVSANKRGISFMFFLIIYADFVTVVPLKGLWLLLLH